MATRNLLWAAGLAAAVLTMGVPPIGAQGLRVVDQAAISTLSVPMNRALVVESDRPFAELSIANPAIADISTLSDRTIYVLGKSPGRTTLTLLDSEGRLISNVDVHVAPDLAEFKERLRQILPGEQIEVRSANDGVVLSGVVSSPVALDRALELAQRYAPERVSNMMSVGGTQQVQLKVRFAEMQRSVRKALGNSLAVGGSTLGGELGVSAGTGTLAGNGNSSSILNGGGYASSGDPQGAFAFGFGIDSLKFALLIEALEAKGAVRTLAEPNLTALSGQEARFLAGGEFPVPVVGDEGNVGVDYKPFGIEMTFTPRVVEGNIINLQLNTAVSGIDPSVNIQQNGFSVNGFRRRETSTTVEIRDGESFAIAGLLQDDFQDLAGQVPFLGDIPVLGPLFRSVQYERRQSELVVIITPHLVSPVRGEALALPTDRVVIPSERELFLYGRTEGGARRAAPRQSGAVAEVARQGFSGSYGYVME